MSETGYQRTILLIEDNEDHAEIMQFHINEHDPEITVHRINDGELALNHIREHHARSNGFYPWLVLLDIKLPKYDGHELLALLKRDEELRKIPVVMFTTSNANIDIERALKAGANSYIQKPTDIGGFERVIADIIDYWKLNQHDLVVEMMNRNV